MIAKTILYVCILSFFAVVFILAGNCGHHYDNGGTYYKA